MDVIKEGMLASAKAAEAAARLGESLFGGKQKFNSQICTSRSQSERLLSLGLKKETADMFWTNPFGDWIAIVGEGSNIDENNIPAWGLHRLIEMIGDMFEVQHWLGFNIEKDYDHTIDCIEWLIEDNRFNKEYLV